jgi:hypothetical protein
MKQELCHGKNGWKQSQPALFANPWDSRIGTCKKAICFHAGFDAVFHTLLKANPERRLEKAAVEARRADCF